MSEAVLATFSDYKTIKTRSTFQLIFEIPIDQADEALRILGGTPMPSEERWVGIARAPKERKEAAKIEKEHRLFNTLPLSQQAGIRGGDAQFTVFMTERGYNIGNVGDAPDAIRSECGIASRSELDTNDIAAAKWRKLEEDYQAYLTDLRYAGTARL